MASCCCSWTSVASCWGRCAPDLNESLVAWLMLLPACQAGGGVRGASWGTATNGRPVRIASRARHPPAAPPDFEPPLRGGRGVLSLGVQVCGWPSGSLVMATENKAVVAATALTRE
jgi:hypothetical protein